MPTLHTAPLTVALNTQGGYIINLLTGDSIQPIINSLGDTIQTGVPVPANGKAILPENVSQPKTIPTGEPKVVHTNLNVHKIPESLTVIPVNTESLKTFTPGVDTSSFVLVNSTGDTVPTGVPIPVKGKVVPCRQAQPVKALPPRMKENASINIRYLDVQQGMNSSNVLSILEDSHGNLWFGTVEGGVSMYNGESFTHFTQKEGLSSNRVNSILEDSDGNLWFGTQGGASMYNGESFTHFTEKEGLSNNIVNSILEDSHGNLWFGTGGGGVTKYNGETFTHFTEKEGLSNNWVSSILEDSHGKFWFGTDGGVSMYNGETFTYFTEKEGLSNNIVSSILEDSNGNLWFGTGDFGTGGGGVSMYSGETFTHFAEKEGFSNYRVSSILEDSHGNIWLCNWGGGVSIYNGETFTHFTLKEGLRNDLCTSIMEDSHGNIWIGSWPDGVSIYNGNTFKHYTQKEGLSRRSSVHSILEDSRGNLWIGTYFGGVSMYNGKSFTHFTEKEGLSNNWVLSILEDSHGYLWFGTRGGGVSRYNGETFTHFTEKEGLSNNSVNSILEDSDGNLWFGTEGGASRYNGESFTHFTEKEGLSSNSINSILEDSDGYLWFGTWGGGVSRYNGETFTHFTEKEGLCNNIVRFILEDSHGNLWFATEGGASMYNGDTFTHFTKKEGLSDNSIFSILEDSSSNIWLGTQKGLNRLEFSQDSAKVVFYKPVIHTYGLQDGLKGVDFTKNGVFLDSRNRIWWGTLSGLIMLEMNNFKVPVEPPASMQLNWIDINGQFIDYYHLNESAEMKIKFDGVARNNNYPLNLELPYFRNHLTFHFSAIDWSAPHRIIYSYKMEGLNDNWSNPRAEAKADFRSLPYGTFTFKVRAIGAAQIWSESFEYTFTILPPWWHSWWARSGYGITALLFILGVFRWRTARLKQRQKELVSEVRNATKEIRIQKEEVESQRDEIEAQRNMVTAQKDEIQQQKEATTDSIEYAKRIQAATFPPDEVLRYLLPKHFILYKPLDIVSGDFYWLTQQKEKIIIAVADCTGHGVPGAFMSMLGSALLKDVVNNLKNNLQANLILNELRDQVILSLRQTGEVDEARDGMDISLCILDRDHMTLQYAGAHNPLYHVRNGKLTEVKADMMPIGISSEAAKSFSNHEMELRKDDVLYLFSDGYTDQLGGERRKRFMTSRFKQLLLEIQDRIMFDQKAILEQKLNEWMGLTGAYEKKYEQIDDILVMGIRIN